MNWIQENKKLAGIFGVTIVGALGLGVLLFLSYGAYAARIDEYGTVGTEVRGLKSQKLFPSTANAAEKEKLVKDYSEKVNLLRDALLNPSVQQPITPLSETELQAKLKERVNIVKKAAESSGILLPSDFALGFDEYTTTVPRAADVAAELSLHLDVIEKLVATLIESGVKSLDSLERTKLPTEKAPAPAPVVAPVKKTPKAAGNKSKKPIITAAAAAEPVLDRYPIKLTFTSDQAPFQSVMNILSDPAKMPHFLVVRQLRVENEKLEGPLKDEIRNKKQQAINNEGSIDPALLPKTELAAAGVQTLLPPPPATPDTFTIMGEEMLKIYLEVDYIRFRKAAAEEADSTVAQP